jgi:hypothetical protein
VAHSYADQPTLTCAECGRAFTAELWLTIDAAERPDLLARVRDGSIHHVVCPRGHAAAVDAPLLIYRPGQSPPILFSPAERTTPEQDGQMAGELLNRLARALGAAWRDAWLDALRPIPRPALAAVMDSADPMAAAESPAEAIPPGVQAALTEIAAALAAEGVVVRSQADLDRELAARPALRARLAAAVRVARGAPVGDAEPPAADAALPTNDEPADPLKAALQSFVQAETWLASYQFVNAHPELLTDATDAALTGLIERATTDGNEPAAQFYAEHLALLRRARAVGAAQAFAEKLETTAEQLDAAAAAEAAAASIPPAVRQTVEEIGAALRAEGVTVDSPEALRAALAERPELAARLAAALGGGEPDAPPQYSADVQRANEAKGRYLANGNPAALDEAGAAWERVLDDAGFTTAPESFQLASLNNAAIVFIRRYQIAGRLTDLDRALALWQDAVRRTPADSPDRAMYLNNLGNGLSDRYARTGRIEELDAAIAAYEDAVATLDSALLDSPVAFVLGQQARWAGLYARTVDALAAAGRAADALAAAEGSKSRLLAGLVGRGELPAPAAIPPALIERERALAGQLNALDTAELAGRGAAPLPEGSRDARAVAQRAAVVAELRAAWDEMAAAGPAAAEYVAARRGDRLSAGDLARLAEGLAPGAALLSLFTTGRRTLLWLWPAGAAAPRLLEPELAPDALRFDYLANYVDEVLNRSTHLDLGRPLTHRWRALGLALLGPLRPHLAGVTHLVVAPEGVYHQLPLHALWLSDAGDTLIDHCAVSTVPALSLLERLRRREQPPAAPGAVFGYTPADPTTRDGRRERAVFLGEARDVAGLLGVAPRLDGEATGLELDKATTNPLRLLHLSCHGTFNTADALESGVGLADGLYTAGRFLARPLPVELVTLSACQTGISRSLGGDEMAGFSLALLTAGARSLLLGLWSVEAQTTARLLVAFYERLWGQGASTTDKAAALRQTMLALRDGRLLPAWPGFDPSDPFYWAPFTLVGDWR